MAWFNNDNAAENDILSRMKGSRDTHKSDSTSALDCIYGMIDSLEYTNAGIDSNVGEIDRYVAEMGGVRDDLIAQKNKNSSIIGKFRELLGDTTTEAC